MYFMDLKQAVINKMIENKLGLAGFVGAMMFFCMNFVNNYIWETQVYHTDNTIRLMYWKEAVGLHLPIGKNIGKKDVYINDEEYDLIDNVSKFHITYVNKITQRRELLESIRDNHWERSDNNTYYKLEQDNRLLLLVTYTPLKGNEYDEIVDIVIKRVQS